MPRGLHKPAVATLRAASGFDAAVKCRLMVRPNDDLAATAGCDRIGCDLNVFTNIGLSGVLFRPFSLIVAADQDLTAACVARSIEDCAAGKSYLVAEEFDRTSEQGFVTLCTAIGEKRFAGGGVQRSTVHHLIPVQQNPPTFCRYALCLNDACIVDHRLDQFIRRPGRHLDQPPFGLN